MFPSSQQNVEIFFFFYWINWENEHETTFFLKMWNFFRFCWNLASLACEQAGDVWAEPYCPPKKDTLCGWLGAWLSLPVENASGDQHWKDVEALWWSKCYVYRLYSIFIFIFWYAHRDKLPINCYSAMSRCSKELFLMFELQRLSIQLCFPQNEISR